MGQLQSKEECFYLSSELDKALDDKLWKKTTGFNLANYNMDESLSELSIRLEERTESSPLRVELPPRRSETETSKLLTLDHDDASNHGNQGSHEKSKIHIEEYECGVHFECSEKAKQEWAFTLYDFDGHGKITKEDLASLLKALYDAVGSSIKLPPNGAKTLKLRLTVGQETVSDQPNPNIKTTEHSKAPNKTSKHKVRELSKLNNLTRGHVKRTNESRAQRVVNQETTPAMNQTTVNLATTPTLSQAEKKNVNSKPEVMSHVPETEHRHLIDLVQENLALNQGRPFRKHQNESRNDAHNRHHKRRHRAVAPLHCPTTSAPADQSSPTPAAATSSKLTIPAINSAPKESQDRRDYYTDLTGVECNGSKAPNNACLSLTGPSNLQAGNKHRLRDVSFGATNGIAPSNDKSVASSSLPQENCDLSLLFPPLNCDKPSCLRQEKCGISSRLTHENCGISSRLTHDKCGISSRLTHEKCGISSRLTHENCDIPSCLNQEKCDIFSCLTQEKCGISSFLTHDKCNLSSCLTHEKCDLTSCLTHKKCDVSSCLTHDKCDISSCLTHENYDVSSRLIHEKCDVSSRLTRKKCGISSNLTHLKNDVSSCLTHDKCGVASCLTHEKCGIPSRLAQGKCGISSRLAQGKCGISSRLAKGKCGISFNKHHEKCDTSLQPPREKVDAGSHLLQEKGDISSYLPQRKGDISSHLPQEKSDIYQRLPLGKGDISSRQRKGKGDISSCLPQGKGDISSCLPRRKGDISSCLPQGKSDISSCLPQGKGDISSCLLHDKCDLDSQTMQGKAAFPSGLQLETSETPSRPLGQCDNEVRQEGERGATKQPQGLSSNQHLRSKSLDDPEIPKSSKSPKSKKPKGWLNFNGGRFRPTSLPGQETLPVLPDCHRRHRFREKNRDVVMQQVAEWIEREHVDHVVVQRHEHHHIHEHHHHHHFHHHHET